MSNIDSTASKNRDVYARVTAQIVTAIENGIGSWRMPWHTSGPFAFSPVNTTTKKPCRAINIVCLWGARCQSLDRDGLVTRGIATAYSLGTLCVQSIAISVHRS